MNIESMLCQRQNVDSALSQRYIHVPCPVA